MACGKQWAGESGVRSPPARLESRMRCTCSRRLAGRTAVTSEADRRVGPVQQRNVFCCTVRCAVTVRDPMRAARFAVHDYHALVTTDSHFMDPPQAPPSPANEPAAQKIDMKIDVRKGQVTEKMSRDALRARFMARFYDPAFRGEDEALARLENIAWDAYSQARKSPVTDKAGPGFAD